MGSNKCSLLEIAGTSRYTLFFYLTEAFVRFILTMLGKGIP